MSLKIRRTRVVCPTSTGTQDITISGFGTPKAAIFLVTRATSDASPVAHSYSEVGITDGTRNRTGCFIGQDGVTTTNTRGNGDATSCIQTRSGAGVQESDADFSAWITDGIRINWTDAPPSAYLMDVILIGGTDVEVHANSFTMASVIDTAVDITTPAFRPTDLLVFQGLSGGGDGLFSIGFVHENGAGTATQHCLAYGNRDNVATSEIAVKLRSAYGAARISRSGGNIPHCEFAEFDANGFSCYTRLSATGATVGIIIYLALRITTYESKVGYFGTPISTGNNSQTGPGFKPQFLFQLLSNVDAVDTNYLDNRAGTGGISISDASGQSCQSWAYEDGVTTTNAENQIDSQMAVLHDDDGTSLFATTFVSFDTTGWTQNFTAVAGAAKQWIYWAIEEEAASGGITGDLNITFDAMTVTADSSVEVNCSLDQTLDTMTVTSDGSVAISADLNQTLNTMTVTSDGSVAISADLNQTLDTMTVTSEGAIAVNCSLDQSFENMTVEGIVNVSLSANLNAIFDAMTLISDATVGGGIHCNLDVTFDTMTAASDGNVAISGVLNQVFDSMSLTSESSVAISGSLIRTLDAMTLVSEGDLLVNGNLDQLFDEMMLIGETSILVTGILDAQLDAMTLFATATVADSLYVYANDSHSINVRFRDKRSLINFRDKRAFIPWRDKRESK